MEYDPSRVLALKSRNLLVHEEVYHVKFESFRGCNLNCTFCGATRQKKEPMSREVFHSAIEGLNPNRFKMAVLSGHGEPTLNKDLEYMIQTLHDRFPKVLITTYSNMTMVPKYGGMEYLLRLFNAGLTHLQADLYTPEKWEWFQAEFAAWEDHLYKENIEVVSYYSGYVPACVYYKPKQKRIVYVRDESLNSGKASTRREHNWGGNLDMEMWPDFIGKSLNDFPLSRTCSEPMKYAYILANGDVTMCCRNGSRSTILGNVLKTPLTEIWQGRDAQVIRFLLSIGRRDLIPGCYLCNFRSFRDGLSPHWGRTYSMEECLESLKRSSVKTVGEPLWDHLETIKDKLPEHLRELLEG